MIEVRILKSEKKVLRNDEEKRKARGYELFVNHKVTYTDMNTYTKFKVKCSTDKGAYNVDLVERSCTCPDYTYRFVDCKHIFASFYARHEVGYPLDFDSQHLQFENLGHNMP